MWLNRVAEALNASADDPLVRRSQLSAAVTTAVSELVPVDDGIAVLTPSAPADLVAVAGFEFITLSWDTPTYYGHATSEVWRSTDADFNNAALLATLAGRQSVFSDYVGTQTEYRYWVRFKNINNAYGPYSGPVSAETAYDVDELLTVLTSQLTQSQLAADLSNLVGGLDGNYVVKAAVDGVTASGFGLASTTDASGATIGQFAVLADQFFLLPPVDFNQAGQPSPPESFDGALWRNSTTGEYRIYEGFTWNTFEATPFVVQLTPTTVDGVDVPPGVYIKEAFIRAATITGSQIKKATIDNANIVDATLTSAKVANLDAAKITTGGLQSYGFDNSPTTPGFLIQLGRTETFDGDGNPVYAAEDVQLLIRDSTGAAAVQLLDGVVTLNAAQIRSTLQSVGYGASAAGFQFDVDSGTFTVRGPSGTVIMSSGAGLNGTAVQASIQSTLTALQNSADTAQVSANTAQASANTAQASANTAQAQLDDVFEVDTVNGGFKFVPQAYSNFFDNDNTLKAFAFLEQVTPDNFTTFFANAALGQAAIGAAAIGSVQIEDAAVVNAKLGTAAVKEANIDDLAVGTLKIGNNAVTVPLGAGGVVGFASSSVWQNVGTQLYVGEWVSGAGPTALLIGGRIYFLGSASPGGGNAGEGGASVRMEVDFQSSATSLWTTDGSAYSLSEAGFSFQSGYGGVVNTSFIISVPSWAKNARVRVQGMTGSPPGQSTAHSRYMSNYNLSVLAAKR